MKTILLILLRKTGSKLMFEIAKDMYFDEKALGNKSIRDRTLII